MKDVNFGFRSKKPGSPGGVQGSLDAAKMAYYAHAESPFAGMTFGWKRRGLSSAVDYVGPRPEVSWQALQRLVLQNYHPAGEPEGCKGDRRKFRIEVRAGKGDYCRGCRILVFKLNQCLMAFLGVHCDEEIRSLGVGRAREAHRVPELGQLLSPGAGRFTVPAWNGSGRGRDNDLHDPDGSVIRGRGKMDGKCRLIGPSGRISFSSA